MQYRRRPLVLVSMLLGVLSLMACKKDPAPAGQESGTAAKPAAPAETGELNLLIFPDYIDEKIIKDFEVQTKAQVRLTRYDSTEEMESKLAYAGAESQYDVVIMASQILPRMVRRGLVRPLDHAQIPNLKNLEPRFSGA